MNVVNSASYLSIAAPFLVLLVISIVLHLLNRVFLLSSSARSRRLFAETPWLPLRFNNSCPGGEEVAFETPGKITLRGTYFRTPHAISKGAVLFCHELNGTRANVAPYLQQLLDSGFDLLTFDFRNHGQSDQTAHGHPTPWMTTCDWEDVNAAVRYLEARLESSKSISVFGLGKGATIALCVAGSNPRVQSVVLDAPIPENRLFEKNCWDLFAKALRSSRRSFALTFSLFFRAVLYSIACPFVAAICAWQRFMLGRWCGCRFINPWPFVRNVRQPMMIIHGHADSQTRADQIQAFCEHLPFRPKLWIVSAASREGLGRINAECSHQVANFFAEHSR